MLCMTSILLSLLTNIVLWPIIWPIIAHALGTTDRSMCWADFGCYGIKANSVNAANSVQAYSILDRIKSALQLVSTY